MKPFLVMLAALISAAIGTAAQAGSIQSNISAFEAEDCKPVVEDYLDRKNIDRSQIKLIEYITIHLSGGEFGEQKDYEGWVSFKGCKGNLIIKMNRGCFIQTDYVTNQCNAQGLPKN